MLYFVNTSGAFEHTKWVRRWYRRYRFCGRFCRPSKFSLRKNKRNDFLTWFLSGKSIKKHFIFEWKSFKRLCTLRGVKPKGTQRVYFPQTLRDRVVWSTAYECAAQSFMRYLQCTAKSKRNSKNTRVFNMLPFPCSETFQTIYVVSRLVSKRARRIRL